MTKYFSFCFLLTFTLFFSCHDDDGNAPYNNGQNYNPTEFAQNFGNAINRTFLGTVIDKNHNPIPDVTITIGNTMAQTDANGVFIITDAPVYERFGYIKAEKTGYITGSRSVVPSEGTNKVEIMLLEETVIATVNSGSVENIILPNGAAVELQGNYSKEDGTAYTGSVSVILHHLNPTDEDMQLQMPGMLYAANSENQERLLQTFGMLAVELKGSSGEALNLAEGSTAQITVPLDASLLSNAPLTIPLWHFDEEHGYWVEDGEATLVGNAYVGTVSHFSFWNCDIPTEAAILCINVTDENGNNLANQSISITSTTFGTTYGYTNEQGQVCGYVPSNETLELYAYNYDICENGVVFNSSIGPFSSDSSIDITIPDNPEIVFETVTGTFNDCNGNPVTEGYVSLNYGNHTFTDYVTDGIFEINLIRCSTSNVFAIEGVDYVNLQQTDSINYTFTTPITSIGTISACDSVERFITYQVDNSDPITFFDVNSVCIIDEHFINAGVLQFTNISLIFLNNNCSLEIGQYEYPFNLSFSDPENNFNSNLNEHSISLYINHYLDIGIPGEEEIDINFSGTYIANDLSEHNLSGVIHLVGN